GRLPNKTLSRPSGSVQGRGANWWCAQPGARSAGCAEARPCPGTTRSGLGYFRAEVMMMAEGQGNGNDSPERDSAWQSGPGAGGSRGAPDAATDPGAGDAAPPEQRWSPFATTSPAGEAEQPAPGAQQAPGPPPVPGAQQAPGPQPVPGEQPVSGAERPPGPQPAPGEQPAPPPADPSSPWHAQPGSQPTWP